MTDLIVSRDFDAPRPLVYRAFTDPDQLAAWFGPIGWSVPRDTVEIDARPGGGQRFTMVNEDDRDAREGWAGSFTKLDALLAG